MKHMTSTSRSVRHRARRRASRMGPYVWGCEPVISPYMDRLRDAAMDGHVCQFPTGRDGTGADFLDMVNRTFTPSETHNG